MYISLFSGEWIIALRIKFLIAVVILSLSPNNFISVFRFKCKEKILCSSLYPIGKFFEKFCEEKGIIGAGGSVATTAWDFARYCGCPEIFVAGLDLGFPDNKTHAKGSLFEEKSHASSNRIKNVETASSFALHSAPTVIAKDYRGESVLTDTRMSLYSWWFESKVAAYPMQPTYSLTHKSSYIPGIRPFNLSDLINRPILEKEREQFFFNMTAKKDSFDKDFNLRKERLNKGKESLLVGLTNLQRKANIGLNICDEMLKKIGSDYFTKNMEAAINQLEQIDRTIVSSDISEIASFVFPSEKQLEKLYEDENIDCNSNSSIFIKSKIIYRELISSVKIYLKLLS